jgi:xanthine dehydrogenase YagR molybdenum-binding subunit
MSAASKPNGKPVPRIDGRLKVTGAARYPADIHVGNLAHAVLVTSTVARGRVERLEVEQARAVPGVLAILKPGDVAADLDKPEFGNTSSTSIAPLHEPKVWHDGQIIGLVVAESFEAASEAAALVRVDYAPEPASATIGSPGAETVAATEASDDHEEDVKAGDFDAAYARSPFTIDATYSLAAEHHNAIELYSTTAAWSDGKLTIWEPTQNVNGWRFVLAKQLRMDPSDIRIVSPYIGGAFGGKAAMTPRTAIVALAAKRLNRPVRCVVNRMQAFSTQVYRAETRHRIRIGATRKGKILAFGHEGWELTSRADPYLVAGTDISARLYDYGAVATKVNLVRADRNTPGDMRSPPEVPYIFALECAIDEMALALNLDPVEFRRVNDAKKEPIKRSPFTSRSLMQCYDAAAAAFRWSERDPVPGAMRDGEWLIGMGCATEVYPTNMSPAAARVRLTSEGKARVQSAGHEIGTGIRTIAAQVAAERLGLAVDAVEVEMGDSALPPTPPAGGSVSTASIGSPAGHGASSISMPARSWRRAAPPLL